MEKNKEFCGMMEWKKELSFLATIDPVFESIRHFLVWGFIKSIVYRQKIETAGKIKKNTIRAICLISSNILQNPD